MPILPVHFFIEKDGLTANTPEKSFGPISSEMFNLTTSFQANGKKAFSICKGVVLIQPNTISSDKVNLILRPFKQPHPELNIKYFVYRGLKKSDFFDGNKNVIVADPSNSDFIAKIRDDFASFYTGSTPPPFTSKFIGFDDTSTAPSATILISEFFFKESQFVEAGDVFDENDNFELPMIDVGKWLGNFADGDCGIDVVLNYGDYKQEFDNGEFTFDLNYARTNASQISVSSADTAVVQKQKREQITQFIDVAAFYGLYVKEGVVKVTDSSGAVSPRTGLDIYNDLMTPFTNKNKVYMYIQSNRHRSYNYYNNYQFSQISSNNLKTGVADSLAETIYGNLSWPLHIFDNAQTNSEDYNDISIQLIASYTYEEIGMYIIAGEINSSSNRNFVIKKEILNSQTVNQNLDYTKTISFRVPNIDISGQKKNICSLIKMIYIGNKIDITSLNNQIEWGDKKRYLLYNNIFPNVTITPIFSSDQNLLISAVNKTSLISYRGFSNLMNESVLNSYVVFHEGKKVAVNTDLSTETFIKEKVLFISKKIETLDDFSIHQPKVFTKGVHSSKMSIDHNIADYSSYFTTLYGSANYFLKHYLIVDAGISIKLLSLEIENQFDYCFYNLGITKEELNVLKGIIPANSSNVDFYLQDSPDNPYISSESNITYIKYSLGIVYENTNGIISVLMPQETIYVYGISHKFMVSKEYSEFEEKSISNSINNEITIL